MEASALLVDRQEVWGVSTGMQGQSGLSKIDS
jgi:hypothetical protein